MGFMECAECARKLGSPVLCQSCLNNRSEIERLEAENAALRDALRFYANLPDSWTISAGPAIAYGSLRLLGETARAALAKTEGEG